MINIKLDKNCGVAVSLFILLFSFGLLSCENPFIVQIVEPRTASFESNGGSSVESQTVFKDQPVRKPSDPSRSGYTFAGWYSDNETFLQEWDFAVIPNADITLYAKWEIIKNPVITSAAITVISPIAGAEPNNTASGEGSFTISAVSWTPSAATFVAGTQYTASVTLTANANYDFAEGSNFTATVNGNVAVVDSNTVNKVTISYQFGPAPDVTGISIKTQPHLVYTHGDTLNLSGLVVTLTYGDSSTEDVAFAGFAGEGISALPAHGTVLVCVTHNDTRITVSIGSHTADTSALTVSKANPSVTWPAGLTATYGQTLSNISLASYTNTGGTAGSFSWAEAGTTPVGDAGTRTHNMTFTPTETANYNTLTQAVTVTVHPAPIANAALTIGTPRKGGTPVTTASVPGGSNFTAGTVTWSPNHNPFQSETPYTASVTLTASANYTFTGGLTTRTINGYAANVANNGSTATLSYQFAAIPDALPGTANNPFLVNDETELRYVGKGTANPAGYTEWTLDAHYRQTANITLASNWTPIGSAADSFIGSYNGGGHTITGLTINTTNTPGQGMFGYIGTGGKVENFGLINVNINNNSSTVGGIAGENRGGTIQNCYVTGSITGTSSDVGGIAGYLYNGTIQNCYVTGDVTGNLNVGGIVGNNYGTIKNCVALNQSVTLTGTSTYVGRITGTSLGTRQNNYAWSGMTLTANNSPVSATSSSNGIHGADITAVAAKTQAAWQTAGFTFTSDSPWVWNAQYSRPVLRNEAPQAWPGYLTAYTVTFNANSGTPVPATQTVDNGGKVTEPSAMTRGSYTFAGWYKEAAFTNQWNFATDTVTSATTLYARWTSTVTYNLNNATSGTTPAVQTVNAGSSVTLAASTGISRTGHTFGGWNTQADGNGTNYNAGTSQTLTGNITLYVRWIYTVTFSGNNQTSATGTVPAAITANAGAAITLPAQGSLARTNYTFAGWNTLANGTGTDYAAGATNQTFTGDTTLYAKWTYTVTYNINGGSGTTPAVQTVNAGSSVTLAAGTGISRTNYTFGGWNTLADGTGTNYTAGASQTFTGNTTLYAKWDIVQYTVTFNINGGTGTTPTAQTVNAGSIITLPGGGDLTKEGYSFDGWNTQDNGNGTNYNGGSTITVTATRTLYAKWGITWTAVSDSTFGNTVYDRIYAIAYGNNRFVAGGANGKMAYSTDGISWTSVSDSKFGTSSIGTIAYGNGTFVAVGESGKMAYSTDNGVTWTGITGANNTFGNTNIISGITWGNDKFIAVGQYGSMAYSADGITWTAISNTVNTFGNININEIAYGNDTFVAAGASGKIAYSTDNGATWTAVSDSKFGAYGISALVWGGNKFVASGGNYTTVYSTDGVTWTTVSNMSTFNNSLVNNIAWGGSGRFVAVGENGKMWFSADGVTWTPVSDSKFGSDNFSHIYGIAYGNGRFVAVGDYGKIVYSSEQ